MKKYPFKFLDSYNREDRGIFFGRNEEIAALYEMVFQSTIILVYGASGTGKTSLINCGLAGKFQPHDWLALMVRRENNINRSLEKVLHDAGGKTSTLTEEFKWSDEWSDDVEKPTNQLTPIGRSIKAVYQKSFRPVYLIFDQFEELFILGSVSEQELFIQTVKDILQSEQPVKMIFSIREEYLGHLFEFERAVPQLLQKKLRIEPMNLEKVKQVIIGAAEHEDSNISIKQGESDQVAEGIFDKIKGNEKSRTIQLPFLQVFLDKFYLKITGDKKRKAEAEFNVKTLYEMGEIGDILVNFLEEQVSSISQRLKGKYPSLNVDRTWAILSPFSTLEGTKEPINKEDLYKRLPEFDIVLIDDVVDAFINSRILRYNEGADMFEIAHDALAKPIAEKRSVEETALLEVKRLIESQVAVKEEAREYFTEKQLLFIEPYVEKFNVGEEEWKWITKSEEFNKQSHNKELVKTKKRLMTVYSILGVAILALGFAIFFSIKTHYAEKRADEEKINANIQKQKSKSLALAAVVYEELDKNPTTAIRLAEMAWNTTTPPALSVQKIVSKVFYESLEQKNLFFKKVLKHSDAVYSAVYSTDGKKIVTASGDNTAKIWDVDSGKPLFVLKGL